MPSHGLNKVILIGALAEDPRIKTTGEGRSRLVLRLHTVHRYKDSAGLPRESHGWHTVVVWGARGEALAKFLSKGRRVAVEGRLHGYKIEGEPARWRDEVVAHNVILLDAPSPGQTHRAA